MHGRFLIITFMVLFPGASMQAQQLTLDGALEKALKSHPALAGAAAAVDAERGRKLQAISPPQPEISFIEEEIPSASSLGAGNLKIFQVSQGFDIPLFLGSRGRLYGYLQESAAYQRDFTRARVRADIITAYARLYARQWQLRILETNHALYVDFADRAEKRYRAGEASALESARARSEKAGAAIDMENGRREHLAAIAALSDALGETLPEDATASDSLYPLPVPVAADMRQMEAHPLLRAAEQQHAGYAADASWRWLQYLPSFSASWYQQDFMDSGLHWGAALTAQVPLWFMFDTRGQNAEAGALARQAEAELRQTRAMLESRQRSARASLDAADRAVHTISADLLQEAVDLVQAARKSYDAGEIDYVEYISAQQSANGTWLRYYDALAAWFEAAAEYELTTGITILAGLR